MDIYLTGLIELRLEGGWVIWMPAFSVRGKSE